MNSAKNKGDKYSLVALIMVVKLFATAHHSSIYFAPDWR